MMKIALKYLLIVPVLIFTAATYAQDARSLIKEGTDLNNTQHYTEAIDKLKAALAAEPENPSANYQMGFALKSAGKGMDAVPYLNKVVKASSSSALTGSAYSLLGSIYDQANQPLKSIENYQLGIKADTSSAQIYYNLGLAYFRNKQFAQAEQSAISALRIEPSNAASMRLYALVAFHQDKRAGALLGLCTFLWLDPNGDRAAEANDNIKHILQGGVLHGKPAGKPKTDVALFNQAITEGVMDVARRRYLVAADMPSEELTAIFNNIGPLAAKQHSNDLFHRQTAFYYKMAQAGHVQAFGRYIRQSVDKDAKAWLDAHTQQVAAMQDWVKANQYLLFGEPMR